jgi:GSH-dependent disulfide-bond oxidoreductase
MCFPSARDGKRYRLRIEKTTSIERDYGQYGDGLDSRRFGTSDRRCWPLDVDRGSTRNGRQIVIDLYYWPTPNGHKITIFLEEAGLEYGIFPVNIGKGEQFKPDFLKIAPNNRMPAIIDRSPADGGEPISVFESGAILLYLAEKTGKFLSPDLRTRLVTLEWLFWQMGGLGPMAGQNHHFSQYAPEKIPYAIDRYTQETNRLYGVLNRRLDGREYIAEDYSIADMACYPWIVPHERQGQKLEDFPHLQRWFETLKARPAIESAYEKGRPYQNSPVVTAESRAILFGQSGRTVEGGRNEEKKN